MDERSSRPQAQRSQARRSAWGAGTLAGYRGRGAYRALVMERCRHAHALGATLALVKANTVSSVPILQTAGFRPVASERRYALKMTAPPRPQG